ncbi:PepSY domain-containing protein [Dyadobacter sp. CY312]|uniref:PepSY-associated TM helix domain-containing protein n=1 Tax=Dyadobacter sp. CY312 TaxID=2907303 RepID=UPI001F15F876|nr:PepSY-associated TM helix domain-containing protein [Dyadobacter sp. CY312]MCE7043615.1 PepSY domain-containing protein [Dyadobacter sp. CY312]
MKKILKNIASQLHLWLGVSSGLVVFIVALTGCLLVFEEELEPVINRSFHITSVPSGSGRLSLDSLTQVISTEYPNNKLSRIIVEPEEDRTVVFGLKQGKSEKELLSVAVDPYTGKITGSRQEHDTFFEVVIRLHRYLCMGDTGKIITGISCICFLVIMITGLVLWWPGRKNRKQRFKVKWDASPKRLNWDLHAVFGFYALPFVFLIASTGLVWSYKWVNNLIYLAFDGKPQQKREAPSNLISSAASVTHYQQILNKTDQLRSHTGKVTFTTLDTDSLSITVAKTDDEAAISNIVSFLYFDKNTGSLISTRLYENETPGFKARRVVFPIHTGSLLGWPTKIIAFIAALITASLPVTGIIIWLGRKKKRKKKVQKAISQSSLVETEVAVQKGVL